MLINNINKRVRNKKINLNNNNKINKKLKNNNQMNRLKINFKIQIMVKCKKI